MRDMSRRDFVKILGALGLSAITLNGCQSDISYESEEKVLSEIDELKKKELAHQYLTSNPFLNSEEKHIIALAIPFLTSYLNDNYFNNALITLKQMKINYISNLSEKSTCDKNNIYCQSSDNLEFFILKETFKIINFTGTSSFKEEMAALLAREYLGKSDILTPRSNNRIIKILCEIFGQESILNCFLENNLLVLKQELLKIDGNEKQALYYLDILQKIFTDNLLYDDFKTISINYFNKKYNYLAIDDFVMKDYLELFKTSENGYRVSKSYFNTNKMPYDTVYYDSGEIYLLNDILQNNKKVL